MRQHQDKISDSTLQIQDTVHLQNEQPSSVFLHEVPETPADYKRAEDINRTLTPDWVLYFSVAFLIVLAWLRLIYSKFIVNIFKSALNYQLAIKIFNAPGIIQKKIFSFLNVLYYLTTGIFLYLVLDYFRYYPFELQGLNLLLAVTAFLLSYSIFRFMVMKVTGYLFNRQKLISEAIFHNLLYNKIIGIVIIPFILLLAYTQGIFQDISLSLGLFLLLALNIMRILRLIIFFLKSIVFIFYFILYLCTLEIIPLLVIVKLLLSLS
ncbi:MAG: DUF4271 domain-containing protein [Bacteroidota bacterium]